MSCESSRFRLSIASFLIVVFQCDQSVADNFEAVDLSWVRNATDPLEVLKQGLDFLEDPSKISINNHERWCNLHVTPALLLAHEETLKKAKSVETGDPPKRHHRSHEEKGQSRHSPTDKSLASSSREHNVTLETDKLGDAIAQACLSVVRMSRVVEKAHNSKTTEALLVRQCLEKASVEAVDSMKDEIQGTRTSADMWRVEKRITVQVSRERAKAYCILAQHHDSVSDDLTGKGGLSTGVIQASRSRGELPQIYQQLSFHSHYQGCQGSW